MTSLAYRNLSILVKTLLLICLLSACEQPVKKQHAESPVLIEVGQRQLTLEQFNHEMEMNYPDISTLGEVDQLQLKTQLITQLIDRELILGEAARLDVRISPDDLDQALGEARGSYTAEEFDSILASSGKTDEAWVKSLKLRLLTTKVSAAILAPQLKISQREREEYYHAHKEDFRRPVEIRARQMLFHDREEAQKVYELLKQGQDFATLARQYSHSPDHDKGGALGYFSRGQLPESFDAVLFKLGVRQYSEPVKTAYGYHLFIVERRRRAGLRPYAAVEDEIHALLSRQKEEQVFHQWLEKLQQEVSTKVHWPLLKPGEQKTQTKEEEK